MYSKCLIFKKKVHLSDRVVSPSLYKVRSAYTAKIYLFFVVLMGTNESQCLSSSSYEMFLVIMMFSAIFLLFI